MCKKYKKCYNCRFATEGFKVFGLTHHHCYEPTQYPQSEIIEYKISPWDTLREWWDTCKYHEPLKEERFIDTLDWPEPKEATFAEVDGLPF